MAGHAQDFVFLLQLEGVGLLGISPGGVAATLDLQIPFVVHGTVRHLNPDCRSVHPFRLAGDGLLSGGLDPDDGQSRVLDHNRIVLVNTVLREPDNPRFRQVNVNVGGRQFLVAHHDAVRPRDEGKAHGGEIRLCGEDDRERVGPRVQGGVYAVDTEAGDIHLSFHGIPLCRFFFFFLTGEKGEGNGQ